MSPGKISAGIDSPEKIIDKNMRNGKLFFLLQEDKSIFNNFME
jgi:hypothetical protein